MISRRYFTLSLLALLAWTGSAGAMLAVAEEQIELTIDYGDGFQKRYTEITPRVDFTVIGVLEAAERHPRGVVFQSRGSGALAFVESIDGVANQGGGKQSKNWRFYLNGQLAKQGAGAQKVDGGDRVLWKFEVGD